MMGRWRHDVALLYYLLSTLYTFAISFTKTTFVLFLLERQLARLDVHLVFAVFTLASLSLEPLTAAYGELHGRQRSFLLGCAVKAVAAVVFFLGLDFWHFVAAEILSGLGATLVSGSLVSWMVNQLRNSGRGQEVYLVLANRQRLKSLAYILGGLAGAYLGSLDLALPWLAVAVSMVVTGAITALVMGETGTLTFSRRVTFDLRRLTSGYRQIYDDPRLALLLSATFVMSLALAFPSIYWLTSLSHLHGFPIRYLGWAWVGIAAAHFLGSSLITVLVRLFRGKVESLIILTVLSCVFLCLTMLSAGHPTSYVLWYLLFEFFKPHHEALKADLINHLTDNERRLTVLSVRSLLADLGRTVGLLGLGLYAQVFGDRAAWMFSALWLLVAAAIMFGFRILAGKQVGSYHAMNALPNSE